MTANARTALPVSDVSGFYKLLADDTRRAIVRMLAVTDMRAGELVDRLRAPQNALSYLLRQLR